MAIALDGGEVNSPLTKAGHFYLGRGEGRWGTRGRKQYPQPLNPICIGGKKKKIRIDP